MKRSRRSVVSSEVLAGQARYQKCLLLSSRKSIGNTVIGIAIASIPFLFSSHLHSQPADEYRGKTITLLVGSTAGGGYDLYARTLARFLGKHIPGDPSVVVQNMPGGGSLTSVLYLDHGAPRDGTYITIFNSGILTEAITGNSAVGLDFRKLSWIGSVTPDLRICYTWSKSGIRTWKDLGGETTVTLGATGKASVSYNDIQMLRTVFNRNVRSVLGYPGRSEVHLAIRRGELDGECGSTAGLPDDFLRDGLVSVPVKMVDNEIDGIPHDTPFIGRFTKTDEQRDILRVLTDANQLGRPFVASQALPADRLEILRDAFDATMNDKEFLTAARSQTLSVAPLSGREAQDLVTSLFNVKPEIAAKARLAIQ